MHQALGLAARALFLSSPNPRVGCVIVSQGGEVLGQGFTQRAGEAHAEIMALRDAQAAGRDVRRATAYVTLEPCAHQGRTGPCCDALVAAGIGAGIVTPYIADTFLGQLLIKPLRPAINIDVQMAMSVNTAPSLLTRYFISLLLKKAGASREISACIDSV